MSAVDRIIATLTDSIIEDWACEVAPAPERNSQCPGCGGPADTTTVDLADAGLRQTTVRCLADGPRCPVRVTHERIGLDGRRRYYVVACVRCAVAFERDTRMAWMKAVCPACKAAQAAPKGLPARLCRECQQEFVPHHHAVRVCPGCRNTLAPKPAPAILTPAPDEPCSVCGGLVPRGFRCSHEGADIIDTIPEEEIIMPQVSEAPTLCECGCGEPAATGKRFATATCGKRFAGRKGKGAKRAKSARRSEAKPGECSCGCEKPPLPGSDYASSACRKRAWRARQAPVVPQEIDSGPVRVDTPAPLSARQVVAYLMALTREQRQALADVVIAEDACAELGLAL